MGWGVAQSGVRRSSILPAARLISGSNPGQTPWGTRWFTAPRWGERTGPPYISAFTVRSDTTKWQFGKTQKMCWKLFFLLQELAGSPNRSFYLWKTDGSPPVPTYTSHQHMGPPHTHHHLPHHHPYGGGDPTSPHHPPPPTAHSYAQQVQSWQ